MAGWLDQTDKKVHNQVDEVAGLKKSVDQVNVSILNQNRNTTSEIRKIVKKSMRKLMRSQNETFNAQMSNLVSKFSKINILTSN